MHILYVVMHNRESICLILYCFLKGDVILPNREEMWKDVTTKLDAMRKRYVNRPRHTIQVDYIDYIWMSLKHMIFESKNTNHKIKN